MKELAPDKTRFYPIVLLPLNRLLIHMKASAKALLIVSFFVLTPSAIFGQNPGKVAHTLFLVGDAGEPLVGDSPIGKALRNQVTQAAPNATVLYLGDNIYPGGLADPLSRSRLPGEKVLEIQTSWIKGLQAKGIFIPGNHDWAHWGRKGYEYIRYQQAWLDSLHDENFTLLPREGCPGPVEISITKKFLLVIIDTQWFLHQYDKPGAEGPCEAKTTAEVMALLADIFVKNYDKRIIVAAHHPLITYGDHGGVFGWKDHLFPLTDLNPNLYIPMPVVGSFYPVYRKYFGHIQDTAHPIYQEFALAIQDMLKAYPGSMYVAGHEHALQYIMKDSTHFIVSGAASKFSEVKEKKYAKFARGVLGFTRLQLLSNGETHLEFFQVDKEFPEGKKLYETTISSTEDFRDSVAVHDQEVTKKEYTVAASSQYAASEMKKLFLGENYRAEWAQPITVPVFDIGKINGGLKILQKGGGQQTLSLRLEDSTGHEYVIRSVEKYPEKAIPEMLRKTFAQDLVQDQISAAHPYAAVAVPIMAEAAGIYHTNPRLMYVPDDPRLGAYRKTFANTLVLFEERPAGDWSESSHFGNSRKIVNTSKVLEKLSADNDNHVDEEFVLRSRLFDLVIGDWDRHDDQWRWATFTDKKAETYRPIPRDRDQAFFVNEGILSSLWSRKWALPKFEGFDDEIRWPSGLSFNARYFDRSFLTELSEKDWREVAAALKTDLTDAAIEQSVKALPPEIYSIHGDEIVRKVKSRRDRIENYAIDHYKFLAREVDVLGSNKREQFEIERQDDGDTKIQVFKLSKEGEKGRKLYDRTFKHNETKELRLYGLGGNDAFVIKGNNGGIRVRVIGGDGNDSIGVEGPHAARKIVYYDNADDASHAKGVRDKTSKDPSVNYYDRKAFQYNRLAPLIIANYNPDDGLFIGGGILAQSHGFRKDPFRQRHILTGSVAPLTQSFNFLYRGTFADVVGKWDFELTADVKSPNFVNNFFGWGNESVYDDEIEERPGFDLDESIDYYRYRFEELRLEPSLVRNFARNSFIRIGPAFQRIEMEEPKAGDDRYILDYASSISDNLFNEYRAYAGANWQLMFDTRDNRNFAKRGIAFSVEGRNMSGINKSHDDFSSYESSLSIIHSFRSAGRLVFAVRAGGGINTGSYEFYQAQVLSGRTELRGFRKTRFYGDQKFYSNFEVRLRLKNFQSYLFPASFGILAFHDLGRVWYKDENGIDPSTADGKSNAWHKGVGGGLWFTPFNFTVLSTEVGHSREGNMAYVRLGFLF